MFTGRPVSGLARGPHGPHGPRAGPQKKCGPRAGPGRADKLLRALPARGPLLEKNIYSSNNSELPCFSLYSQQLLQICFIFGSNMFAHICRKWKNIWLRLQNRFFKRRVDRRAGPRAAPQEMCGPRAGPGPKYSCGPGRPAGRFLSFCVGRAGPRAVFRNFCGPGRGPAREHHWFEPTIFNPRCILPIQRALHSAKASDDVMRVRLLCVICLDTGQTRADYT